MSFSVNLEAIGVNMPKTQNGQVHGLTLGGKPLTPSTLLGEVQSAQHGISTPYEPGPGHRRGRRWHQEIVVTRDLNGASANLFGHCGVTQVTIPRLKLNFLKTNAKGSTQHAFTIELTNAAVVKYLRKPSPRNNFRPHQIETTEVEEISFTFQKITWTWVQGGISASDAWESPT
jgi:type VI secretion system secreted protein Hcp